MNGDARRDAVIGRISGRDRIEHFAEHHGECNAAAVGDRGGKGWGCGINLNGVRSGRRQAVVEPIGRPSTAILSRIRDPLVA